MTVTHEVRTVGSTRGEGGKRTLYYGYCTCGAGTTTSATRASVLKKLADHAAGNDRGIYKSA